MAKKIEPMAISVFCQDMAMMLEAGITPEEAVGLLSDDAKNSEFYDILQNIEKDMINGSRFSQAVEDSGGFPEYAVRMISTGERAGRLDQVLRSLSGFYVRQDNLNRQLRNAVIYPVTLLLMMCAVLAILVTLVIPVFVRVYESMTGALAQSSYAYIRVAGIISWVSLIAVGLVSAAVIAGFVMWRWEKGEKVMGNLLAKGPITKNAVYHLEVSRFIDVLSTFLTSGMDVDTAVEEACTLVKHPKLKEKVDGMTAEMDGGKGLAQALYDHTVLPPLYGRMLLSASRSGQLEILLADLTVMTETDAQQRIQRLISGLEPVLTGFLTVSVGVTLLSIMLPLAGLLSAIG